MATITAADYTVEFKINPNAYRVWKSGDFCAPNGPESQGIAPAVAFKQEMKRVIEENLNKDLQDQAVTGGSVEDMMMGLGRRTFLRKK